MSCSILAIDIGTSTGWASSIDGVIKVGTLRLASDKEVATWRKVRLDRRKDPRVERLCSFIGGLGEFDVIIWEDVEFIQFRKQAQLWSSFRTAVQLCGAAKIFECLPVGTLKKFATGAGNADKNAMGAALKKSRPDLHALCDSDDAVDAVHLLLWAQKNLARLEPMEY